MGEFQISRGHAQVNRLQADGFAVNPRGNLRPVQRGRGHDLILDAAEALFAEKGYNGAGLREITAAAGVRLGLANYHFDSKSALYRSVLARRAPELAGLLIASLETALAGNADVAGILEAYALPHLEKLAAPEPGWRHYLRLVAQTMLLSHHEELVFDAAAIYEPVMRRYRAALTARVPKDVELQDAFHLFRMSILTLTAWNLQSFDSEQPMPARDQLCARLIAVFVAGLAIPPARNFPRSILP